MAKTYRLVSDQQQELEAHRQTKGLAGLAISLMVIVSCLVVMKELKRSSHVEDCMMQGRTNCDLLLAPYGR